MVSTRIQSTHDRIEINIVNMQKQVGSSDCGLFAIACAFELSNGNDPAKIQFDLTKMRYDYQKCIASNEM